MSKAIVYDRQLRNHMVVNDDGSINVRGLEIQGGDVTVNVDDIKVDIPERKLVMTRSYNGIESTDYKLNEPHHFIAVANDSMESTITLLVHNMAVNILPWETFEAEFEPFEEFTIEDIDKTDFRVAVFQKKEVVADDE